MQFRWPAVHKRRAGHRVRAHCTDFPLHWHNRTQRDPKFRSLILSPPAAPPQKKLNSRAPVPPASVKPAVAIPTAIRRGRRVRVAMSVRPRARSTMPGAWARWDGSLVSSASGMKSTIAGLWPARPPAPSSSDRGCGDDRQQRQGLVPDFARQPEAPDPAAPELPKR